MFLRSFSSFDPPKEESHIAGLIKNAKDLLSGTDSNSSKRVVIQDEWLFRTDPISEILLAASPESKAIIQALAHKLSLQDEELFKKADDKIKEIKKKREELGKVKKDKDEQKKKLKIKIKTRLLKEWPELANTQHPKIDSLKHAVNSSKLITLTNQDNEWSNYKKRSEESVKIENERFKLEKKQVLAMRLKHEIENVVLKAALPRISSKKVVNRYSQIERLEKTTFSHPRE